MTPAPDGFDRRAQPDARQGRGRAHATAARVELAGTDYDVAGLSPRTTRGEAPAQRLWTTLRPQERRAHYALAGRGDAGYDRFALAGDDEALAARDAWKARP